MPLRKLINFVIIAIVSVSLVGLEHVPASAASAQLNMMSWNIQGSKLPGSRLYNTNTSIRTVVSTIKAQGAEYVGLQEVSAGNAKTIAEKLGWGTDGAHVRTAFEHDAGTPPNTYKEGIAIISKYPITGYSVQSILPPEIPIYGDGRGRKLQRAVINKNGTIYHVYNTHLASNDWNCNALDCPPNVMGYNDDINRDYQAKFVLDQMNAQEAASRDGAFAYALGGDLNTHPVPNEQNSLAYNRLKASMTDTWLYLRPDANSHAPSICTNSSGCTASIRNSDKSPKAPNFRIDYFFIKAGTGSLVRQATAPVPSDAATYAPLSDHFFYQMTLGPAPNTAPVARFTWSRQTGVNNPVTLDGTGSSDPDGSITKWEWSVDGTVLPLTSAKGTVSLGAGTSKTVTLKVTDNGGSTHSTSQTLSLPNRRPTIGAYGPNGVIVSSTQPTFTASASDPDGDAIKYFFNVMDTAGNQMAYSGWVGNTWTIPAYKLDPGTKYNWTVTVEDSGSLQEQRAGSFTVAMLPTSADVTVTSSGNGYWIVDTYGNVYTYGDARYFGTLHDVGVNVTNITGLVRTPDSGGYWIVGADGGVYAFGNARFYGSMGGQPMNAPVVGMAATKNGQGYWLVGADGGIFAFGNAGFYGSMGGRPLNAPMVAMAPTPSGAGYWMAAKDGGIFAFGDAPFYGSMGGQRLNYPVVDMDTTPDGQGYWMTAQDGGVFAFGNAQFYGSMAGQPLNGRITGMAVTPSARGYWLNGCDGGIFAFGDAPFYGSNPTYMCAGIQ